MSKKPYLCGKCGERFSRASKYCPSCGAILSLPWKSKYSGAPTFLDSFARSGWIEVGIFMALLGVISYLGMRAVFARDSSKFTTVQTGTVYRDKISKKVIKSDVKSITVPVEDENKYTIKIIEITDSDQKPPEVREKNNADPVQTAPEINVNVDSGKVYAYDSSEEYAAAAAVDETVRQMSTYNRRRARSAGHDARSINIGMDRAQVNALWGAPNSWERYVTDSGRIERWYYGDPLLGIANEIRYVDFNAYGRVIGVRDLNGYKKLQDY